MQFLYYFALAGGANYFTLYYKQHLVDFSGNPQYEYIGVILLVQALVAFFSPLLAGYIADKYQITNRLISLCAFGVSLGTAVVVIPGLGPFVHMTILRRLWLLLPGAVMTQFFLRPLVPLIDTGSLKALEEQDGHADYYGRIRVLGSIGWILCCLLVGRWLDFSGRLVDAILVYGLVFAVLGFISLSGFSTEVKKVDLSWEHLLSDRVLRVLIVLTFIRMISFGMGFAFTGVFLSEMNLTYSQMGLAFGLAAVLEVPFFFKGHVLREKWGSEFLILFDLLLQALRFIIFYLFPQVESPAFYIIVQMLMGLGVCLHINGIVPLLNQIAPPHLKATYQNLYTVAVSLVIIVNGLASSLIVKALGTRSLMGICSLIMAAAFFYTALSLVLPKRKNNPDPALQDSGL